MQRRNHRRQFSVSPAIYKTSIAESNSKNPAWSGGTAKLGCLLGVCFYVQYFKSSFRILNKVSYFLKNQPVPNLAKKPFQRANLVNKK
jgi:hypothetical protein